MSFFEKNKNKFIMIFLLLIPIMSIFYIFTEALVLDDYLWHIKVGEWIIENKQFPKTGILSWSTINDKWMAHEWLSGVITYLFSLIFKSYTPLVLILLYMLTMNTLIILFNKKYIFNNYLLIALLSIINCFMVSRTLPRPFLFGYIIILIYLNILNKVNRNEYTFKTLIPIPFLIILLANFHGGLAIFSYVLPIGYLFCSFFNFKIGKIVAINKTKKQKLTFIGIILTSILSILVNPNGLDLLLYPFMYLKYNNNYISEWHAITIKTCIPFFIFLFVINFILINTKKDIFFEDFGIITIFTFLSLLQGRNIIYAYFVIFYVICKYIDEYKHTFKNDLNKDNCNMLLFLISPSLIIMTIFFCCVGDFNTYKKIDKDSEIIKTIEEIKPERLYNHYNIGGTLINYDIPVFIDPRADLYFDSNIMDEWHNVIWGDKKTSKEEIEKFLEKWNFDYLLLYSEDSNFLEYIENNENYELVLSEEMKNKIEFFLYKQKELAD